MIQNIFTFVVENLSYCACDDDDDVDDAMAIVSQSVTLFLFCINVTIQLDTMHLEVHFALLCLS